METLALLFGSTSLVCSLLGIIWVYRCKSELASTFGIAAITIFAYAIWQFVTHFQNVAYAHLMVHNAFIIGAALLNAHYACRLELTLNINRRKKSKPYECKNRRNK